MANVDRENDEKPLEFQGYSILKQTILFLPMEVFFLVPGFVFLIYPLVIYHSYSESHFLWDNPLLMVMFNSYVIFPEGMGIFLGY